MNDKPTRTTARASGSETPLKFLPLRILAWPFLFVGRLLWRDWLSYVLGSVLRDERRVYNVKFVWYGETVYLHPMVWGSVVLFFVAKSGVVAAGWPLLIWFAMLVICFLTVMYDFDILKAGVLLVSMIALFSLAYVSNLEWHFNPLRILARHIQSLEATVSPGFYIVTCYVFAFLIAAEVVWAWLFNRVELDESYVYEHKFLKSTTREPVFARGLKRDTRDLLELLILGAGDIEHRTKTGTKRFPNVPGASLGLGRAIDTMLNYRRDSEIDLGAKGRRDEDDQSLLEHAMPDLYDELDDGDHDNGGIEG